MNKDKSHIFIYCTGDSSFRQELYSSQMHKVNLHIILWGNKKLKMELLWHLILHMLAFFMLSTVPYQQPLLSPLEMLSFSNFLVHLLGWNLSICFVFKNPRNGLGCLQFVIYKVNVYMIMLVQFSIMSYFLSIMVIHTVQEADLSPFLV